MFGDYILCSIFHWGVTGAAMATSIATILSTVISSILLLRTTMISTTTTISSSSSNVSLTDSTKQSSSLSSSWLSYIDYRILKRFFSTSFFLLLGLFSNTLTYSAGSRLSSIVSLPSTTTTIATTIPIISSLKEWQTIHMAANQIVLFYETFDHITIIMEDRII
jgi:Na+-driven multidrug efflux pump